MEKIFVICENMVTNRVNSAVRFTAKDTKGNSQPQKLTTVQFIFPEPVLATQYIPGNEYEITISESEKPAITGL